MSITPLALLGLLLLNVVSAVPATIGIPSADVTRTDCPYDRRVYNVALPACFQHGVSETIEGSMVTYFTTGADQLPDDIDAWDTALRDRDPALQLAKKAIPEILGAFSKFTSDKLNIKMVLTPRLPAEILGTEFRWGSTHYDTLGGVCYVWISFSPDISFPADADLGMPQLMAHELYHCLEFLKSNIDEFSVKSEMGSLWRIEGGADYFSNVAYPTVDLENQNQFFGGWTSVPLTGDGFSTLYAYGWSLFIQFLNTGLGWSNSRIDSLIRGYPMITTRDEERQILIKDINQLSDIFHMFSKEIVSGKDIIDSSGTLKQAYIPSSIKFTAPKAGARHYEILEQKTWSFERLYETTFKPHDTVKAFAKILPQVSSDRDKLFYRNTADPPGASSWKQLAGAETILTSCSSTPVTIQFLLISTSPRPATSANIDIAVTSKTKCDAPTLRLFRRQDSADVVSADDCDQACKTPKGNCATRTLPLDPCLTGTWNINIPEIESIIRTTLNEALMGEMTVSRLEITGSGTMSVLDSPLVPPPGKEYKMEMKKFKVFTQLAGDAVAAQLTKTDVTFNGWVKGSVWQQGPGEVCITDVDYDGEVVSYSPILGELKIPMEGWGNEKAAKEDMKLMYSCNEGALRGAGSYASVGQAWDYGFSKEVITV